MRQICLWAALVSKICRNSDTQSLSRTRTRGGEDKTAQGQLTHTQKSADQHSNDFVLGFCFLWPFCLESMYLPSLSCLLFFRIFSRHQVFSFVLEPDKCHSEEKFCFSDTCGLPQRGRATGDIWSLWSWLGGLQIETAAIHFQGAGISLALSWFLWPL